MCWRCSRFEDLYAFCSCGSKHFLRRQHLSSLSAAQFFESNQIWENIQLENEFLLVNFCTEKKSSWDFCLKFLNLWLIQVPILLILNKQQMRLFRTFFFSNRVEITFDRLLWKSQHRFNEKHINNYPPVLIECNSAWNLYKHCLTKNCFGINLLGSNPSEL